jgi:hypothetical protein
MYDTHIPNICTCVLRSENGSNAIPTTAQIGANTAVVTERSAVVSTFRDTHHPGKMGWLRNTDL